MEVAAAEILGRDHLARRRLHQRRAAEEDRALVADDHALVGHRRHIGAARGAAAHHAGDLRRCPRPTSAPGCRRSGRNGRGRGRPRPGAAGWRRRYRPDRRRAAGSAARSPARADASSPSSGNRRRPSPSASLATIITSRPDTRPMPAIMPAPGASLVIHAVGGELRRSRGRASPDRAAAVTRSRGSSLPRATWRSRAAFGPPSARLRDLGPQLLGQRAIVRRIGAGSVAVAVDHAWRCVRHAPISSRPISMRRISLVPAPMSSSLASRRSARPASPWCSRRRPAPGSPRSATFTAFSLASRIAPAASKRVVLPASQAWPPHRHRRAPN